MTNRQMSEIVRDQKPLTLPPEATVQVACKHMHDHSDWPDGLAHVPRERSRARPVGNR